MGERWSATDLADLHGRTVVVTGANSGIGLVTARELARVGAHVVLAVRDEERGRAAAATIVGSTDVRRLDLADLGLGAQRSPRPGPATSTCSSTTPA